VRNAARWFSGHVDVGLTAQGRRQAEALVQTLADVPLAHIVSSDLRRAHDTVRPVAASRQLTIETTPALRERDIGAWTRMPHDQAPPDFWDTLHAFRRRPPQGESLADVAHRATRWLAEVPEPEGPVLLAGHGGLLRALLGLLDGWAEDEIPGRPVANTEVFVREVVAQDWRRLAARACGDGSA